jgi:hypothetical protein
VDGFPKGPERAFADQFLKEKQIDFVFPRQITPRNKKMLLTIAIPIYTKVGIPTDS